jgi:hypothetical protein
MSNTGYLDKAALSPTTFDTGVATPSPSKNKIAFGFNRKILNPYIIFQKNQTTVIDGSQPLFSVINKKTGKVSTASSDGYRLATGQQTDVTNIISAEKVTKKGNFFSSSPQTIGKESSKLLPINQRSPPFIKVNDISHADPGRLQNSLMSPQEYC